MRAEAARACGDLEAKKAESDLLALLVDEDQSVRLAAIAALGHLGGRRAREALRALSESEEALDAEAADTALEEMLFFGDGEGLSLLDEDDADEGDDRDFAPWDAADDFDDEELGAYDK